MNKPRIKRFWLSDHGVFMWGVEPIKNKWGKGLKPEQKDRNQAAMLWCIQQNRKAYMERNHE